MTLFPTRLDHDLALRLSQNDGLTDIDRATCMFVALAAVLGEPVSEDKRHAFNAILRTVAT
jgi:hypothetical protein